MAQPVSVSQFKQVAAAGTTVISDIGAGLQNVIIGGTFVGSVEWYDSSTAAGTAAGNLIFNVGLPATFLYRSIPIAAQTKKGLVVVATGTPSLTYTYDA